MFPLVGCANLPYKYLVCATLAFQFGCATPIPIPDRTLQLREVAHVLSRDEIVSGEVRTTRDNRGREPINWPNLHEGLLKSGMQDKDMVDGSVVIGRTQFYWHNVASGIVRQYVRVSRVTKGLQVSVGNIVEVEQTGGLTTVVRVKYTNLAEGKCEYKTRDRGAVSNTLSAINPVGGSGAASLFCPYLEQEGWGASQHAMGVEWFKPPLKGQ